MCGIQGVFNQSVYMKISKLMKFMTIIPCVLEKVNRIVSLLSPEILYLYGISDIVN
jgi:hypothetical protein